MKKFLILVSTVLLASTAFSQVKVRPGFRAGLNLSKITHLENVSRKPGINAAMFVNVHFTRFYELQPELTYSNQGWSRDGFSYIDPYNDVTYNVNSQDVSSHYIGIALTNKFFMSPKLGLHVLLGPGMEFNVSDNLPYDNLTPVDLVFFGGIGYEFPFGLGLEARYKQGIVDVDDYYYDDYNNNYYDDNYYNGKNKLNSVFQFNVYYKFAW
jgi:hypothetical protein